MQFCRTPRHPRPSPQTIKSYLAGVRNAQLSLGLPDPRDQSSLPILRRVQAGISRASLSTSLARVRMPVTPSLLRHIRQCLEATVHNERAVLWAICCVAFFGCFRQGELLLESPASYDHRRHLTWGDIAVDNQANPRMLRIQLKQSKTDQFGRGADVGGGEDRQGAVPSGSGVGLYSCSGTSARSVLSEPAGTPDHKNSLCQ